MSSMDNLKTLREMTSAGMLDCKKALDEANGDIAKAANILREKGIVKAVKKMDREAKEGGVFSYISQDSKIAALIELSCETDFVAKNDSFKELGCKVAEQIVSSPTTDDIVNTEKNNLIRESISKLGENINVGRFEKVTLASNAGGIFSYLHHNSKIGVLIELSSDSADISNKNEFKDLGRNIAMHVAAAAPLYLNPNEVPQDAINTEKEVQQKILKEEGKPDNVIEKIMSGKIKKFISDITLIEQGYIKDPKITITDLIKETESKLGGKISINKFVRFSV